MLLLELLDTIILLPLESINQTCKAPFALLIKSFNLLISKSIEANFS
jgi:hypothetical protein